MNKLIVVLTAALGLTMSAQANIGDTYGTSCKRYGGTGKVNGDSLNWVVPDSAGHGSWLVTEIFQRHRCVAVLYTYSGAQISEQGVWETLGANSSSTQIWQEYADGDPGNRDFVTGDHQLYGCAFRNQKGYRCLRIAYKSWLDQHGVLTYNGSSGEDNELPPVEDKI